MLQLMQMLGFKEHAPTKSRREIDAELQEARKSLAVSTVRTKTAAQRAQISLAKSVLDRVNERG